MLCRYGWDLKQLEIKEKKNQRFVFYLSSFRGLTHNGQGLNYMKIKSWNNETLV